MKTFVRFSFLESYLPQKSKREFLITYYEKMKILDNFRKEPLFWLQYAIAQLSLRQFHEAKQMFDVAYYFARARGYYENRHLDNQFARFLLESRTYSEEFTDFIDAFNKAHQILTKQMQAERTSYNPYRVAQHYFDFATKRKNALSSSDRGVVTSACTDILQRISSAPHRLKSYRVVSQCERKMADTIKILT